MGKIISICNQKGGVGKTTTCVNLSAALGILEKKVLVIDTDPLANATISFGFDSKKLNNPSLEFMDFTSVIRNNIIKTDSPNVDLLPFIEDLNLFKKTNGTSKFHKALQSIQKSYDYILIDCVPFFKVKNLDILTSSDSVIIPVQCDYYALEGLHKFLKTIRFTQKKLNPNLRIEGFLLTMYDKRINLSNQVVNYVRNYFGDLVFKTVINRNTKITQAPGYGKSVLQFDINCDGAKCYLQLASELISKEPIISETPLIPEEKETIFNSKQLSKTISEELENFTLFEKVLQSTSSSIEKTANTLPKNLDSLVNLQKSYIKKILGSCYKNHLENVWVYKIKKKGFFKKKFLFLYFKNDSVSHYTTKWFSI
ncbi:ParA family protein [Tenacibaculum sp. MEBiC06402]|uniref:ParA family protein n=1 Tax=unclassified Tenacibaculum TaxID=2635139 RepID=UPI003B9C27AF